MNVIPVDTCDKMFKDLTNVPDKILLAKSMREHMEFNHVTLTCTLADFTTKVLEKKHMGDEVIMAFTFNEDHDIKVLDDIGNFTKLRKAVQANEDDAVAYAVLLKSSHVEGETCGLSEDEVRKIMEDEEHAEQTLRDKGVELKAGLTCIMQTKRGLSSLILVGEKGTDLIAFSDWDGEMPVALQCNQQSMSQFLGLFNHTKSITEQELKDANVGDVKVSRKDAMEALGALIDDPEDKMTQLIDADGHNGYQAAYAALIKLMENPDLRQVDPLHRKAVIAVLQNRINLLEMSLAEDEMNAQQAPQTIQ